MVYLRFSIVYAIACQIFILGFSPTLISSGATPQEKAFFISEHNCEKLTNDNTGAPILFEGSDLVLLGKTNKIVNTYGPNNARYSMEVTPQCIMKGNTSEEKIVIRNLGKAKCEASNVEVNGYYLFFLRRTSDLKVYQALNVGAKEINSPILWFEVFTLFCGMTKVMKCNNGKCPEACGYNPPDPNGCISTTQTINDIFRNLYPKGMPTTTTTTTTSAPTTTTSTTTTTSAPTTTPPKKKDMPAKATTKMPGMNKNISAEANEEKGDVVTYAPRSEVTPKVGGVKGTTGQAGLSTNVFLILSTVIIALFI